MDGAGDLLRSALIPLATPPDAPAWNHAEMVGLLGDAPRRKASVLLALRDDAQQRLVFTVRTNTLQQHAGQVAFPGGRMEPDDADTIATALRESEEEIGLAAAAVTPLGFLDRFDTISGYCITPVVAMIDPHARLRADPGEVEEIFEVPFAFFLDPANLRRYSMEYRGHQREMVEFLHAGHRIWGATAHILLNLLRRMGRA